jgi:uncharacterized protein
VWRLLVGIVLGAVGFVVVATVALVLVYVVAHLLGFGNFELSTTNINAGMLLGTNLGLAALIPLTAALTRLLYQVRLPWVSSIEGGLRRRWLLTCAGVASAVWGLFLVAFTAAAAASRNRPLTSGVVGLIVVVLLTTPLQAAGEEYLFRGFLLQSLGAARLPTAVCCVVSGGIFAAAHGQFQPALFADRLLLGVVLAWLALRTGGLEAGIAVHALKNVSAFIPAVLLDQTSSVVDPTAVSWVPFGLDVVLLAILVTWLPRRFDRRRARLAAEPPGQPATTSPR